MSTLTKIFVVLLVVFSMTFTAMTVSTVAQTTNWRDTALKYQQNERIADTNLRHAHAAHAAELATKFDEVRGHLTKISGLETEVQTARTEAARVRLQLAQAASEKSSAEAMNRGLLAQLEVAEAARSEYRKQRDGLEIGNIDLERRNIDLNDRVNELTARVDVMLEQRRHFEQQLNILQSENRKLAARTWGGSSTISFEDPGSAASIGVPSGVAAREIRGHVRDADGDLVTISVGRPDGVTEGMIFVMHRKGQYVGDLTISMVDPTQSVGRITVKGPSLSPARGDNVTDEETFRRSRG